MHTHRTCISRRRFMLAGAAAGLLAACGRSADGDQSPVPVDIDRDSACALDGMLLADYPGPKAQIHYQGRVEPDFFCDTVEMFHIHLNPEQALVVRAVFVQDMGQADWDEPRGHWIDAKNAHFVHGSKRRGSMGPTIASFARADDAAEFVAGYGGRIFRFADITPDMVALDGGALHDQGM